jgi:predicted amidohydrolase YtcJ
VGYTLGMKRAVTIVCATLSLAASGPADRLLVGGVVHTPEGPAAVALAIRGGRVAALVPPAELDRWRGEATEVVDLAGAHVVPGLVDAHLHLASYGASLEEVDLGGAGTWAEVVARVVGAAGDLPPGAWLEGQGWDQNLWPGRSFPDRAELDAALPGRAVLLHRVDGHAVVASGRALELAGIGRDTPDPPGGRILRRADGSPTGVLVDTAVDRLGQVVPKPGPADVERYLVRGAEALARVGLTQVHDMGTTAAELDALRRLQAAGRLPLRVWVLLDGGDAALLERELARGPERTEAAMLRVGGVKLYADGALGSRGALLGEDYADDPGNRGLALTSSERLLEVTRRASAAGFQVAIHAIGDEAVHRVLDLFARVGEATCRRLRHRVEHSQVIRPEDVGRFAALSVVASVQPTHCTSDMPWAPERLGPARIAWAYRWRSLMAAGATLAGGSDAPVEDPDPRRGLYAAVTRRQADGRPSGGWNPAERLTPAEALRLFTAAGAFAGHAEGWCGEIRPGAVADLTVLDRDPTAGEPERILHLTVQRTVVGGVDRHRGSGRGPREGS